MLQKRPNLVPTARIRIRKCTNSNSIQLRYYLNIFFNSSDEEDFKKQDRNKTKSSLKEKSMKLAQLLANPLFQSTTKYPTSVLPGTKLKATENESAVSVVKQSVAEHKEWKKNRKRKNNKSA